MHNRLRRFGMDCPTLRTRTSESSATFRGVPAGTIKGIELTGAGKGTELNGCKGGFCVSCLKGLTPKPCTADEHEKDRLNHLKNALHFNTSTLGGDADEIIVAVESGNAQSFDG